MEFIGEILRSLSFGYLGSTPAVIDENDLAWEKIGTVKKIYSHPLEGGYRQETTKAYCSEYGLQPMLFDCDVYFLDRCFFVYDAETKICVSNLPLLVTIKISAISWNETFKLEAPNQSPIEVSAFTVSNKRMNIIYHGQEISVFDCADAVAKWLSNYLLGSETGLRLAVSNGLIRSKLKTSIEPPETNEETLNQTALKMKSDFSGYSLISQASVEEIRSRVGGRGAENFRVNCVIELNGDFNRPYIEDRFRLVKIGNNVEFGDVALCAVSDFIAINPETGVESEFEEPLRTLKILRPLKKLSPSMFPRVDTPAIGITIEIKKRGVINVDDDVFVKF